MPNSIVTTEKSEQLLLMTRCRVEATHTEGRVQTKELCWAYCSRLWISWMTTGHERSQAAERGREKRRTSIVQGEGLELTGTPVTCSGNSWMSWNCWVMINQLCIHIQKMRRSGGEWGTTKRGAEQEVVKSFSPCCWTEMESRSWGKKNVKPFFIIHLAVAVLMHMVDGLQQRQLSGKLKAV